MNLQKLKVALVDDDEDDRFLFKEAIDQIHIKTELSMFENGQKFMDFLLLPKTTLPQVVFLDLNMPVKNGLECLQEIRKTNHLKDLSVAIYSTSSSETDIDETFINGANIYINKPNDFSKLKSVIEKVLQINWQYNTSNLNKENFIMRL
ncbi:response regulator [Formosa algae]|uniref:CheY-like chemotaxis protein n=1 Tax=Formosa algae TaxID=225843 RepID=A0A9X0YM51_9FLAO|nr:response regulator [Formosa algae]MBP1839438.1 CheY-like chemotaxis protein [Formosa algae]MDQ0334742.1 CheY-like chemotaxis protein [Formosa algae]OEI81993.1 transcriptional regulator [Formosa algae]PNW27452.1 response regulator [Formosa algae]